MRRETQLKFYKIMAVTSINLWKWKLGTERERWKSNSSSWNEILLRAVRGITRLDKIPNEQIRKDLKVTAVHEIMDYHK